MITPSSSLSAELRQVDQQHPGWHAFASDEGRIWASHVHKPDGTGCGETLDAATPALMDQKIAQREWELARDHPRSAA